MSGSPPGAVLLDPNDACLRIARVLSARGVVVHALAGPSTAYAARSRHVRGQFLPKIADAPETWLERLRLIAAGGPAVLLPGSDDASELLARERNSIPPTLRSFESAESAHMELMDKRRLYELAASLGVRVPWTRRVASAEDAAAAESEDLLPCVAKPALSHVGKLFGYGVTLVRDRAELRELCSRAARDGVELLLSEYVPGGVPQLEAATVVRAADGTYPLAYSRRKLRQHPIDFGVGSLLCSELLPETVKMTRTICDATGYVGIANLESKRHAETGEHVLIEINVRVPNGLALGDACGIDASWRLYATLAGLPLPPPQPQRNGVKLAMPLYDLRAIRDHRRRGDLSWAQLLRSYRGARDLSMLDPLDPAPAVALARSVLRSRRELRRLSAAPRAQKR